MAAAPDPFSKPGFPGTKESQPEHLARPLAPAKQLELVGTPAAVREFENIAAHGVVVEADHRTGRIKIATNRPEDVGPLLILWAKLQDKKKLPMKSPIKAVTYFALAVVSFVLALAAIWMALNQPERLQQLHLVGGLYYIAVVAVAAFAALVLFGALRSVGHWRGHFFNGVLELGGPAVVFMLVLFGGMKLPATEANFPVTVYVHGPNGPQDIALKNTGQVVIDLNNQRLSRRIDETGQAQFAEIPASYRGQTVFLFVMADGFESSDTKTKRRLTGEPIYLEVHRTSVTATR